MHGNAQRLGLCVVPWAPGIKTRKVIIADVILSRAFLEDACYFLFVTDDRARLRRPRLPATGITLGVVSYIGLVGVFALACKFGGFASLHINLAFRLKTYTVYVFG